MQPGSLWAEPKVGSFLSEQRGPVLVFLTSLPKAVCSRVSCWFCGIREERREQPTILRNLWGWRGSHIIRNFHLEIEICLCVINMSKFPSTDLTKCLSSYHGSKLFSSLPWYFLFILVSEFSSARWNILHILENVGNNFSNLWMKEVVFLLGL